MIRIKLLQRDIVEVLFPETYSDEIFEIKGVHPAVCLHYSDEAMKTVIVVPLSSKKEEFVYKRGRIDIGRTNPKSKIKSVALINQIRTIDKARIIKKLGSLSINQFDMIIEELDKIIDYE